MDRKELIQVQLDAAAVLDAGRKLADKSSSLEIVGRGQSRERAKLCAEALGTTLANPSEFWAGACYIEAGNEALGCNALSLGIQLAATKLAAHDMRFVRESLIGQSQWAGLLAVKLWAQAEGESGLKAQTQLVKLALAAQRQSATALATAAALNHLEDTKVVTGET
jgi:hypothetical protein